MVGGDGGWQAWWVLCDGALATLQQPSAAGRCAENTPAPGGPPAPAHLVPREPRLVARGPAPGRARRLGRGAHRLVRHGGRLQGQARRLPRGQAALQHGRLVVAEHLAEPRGEATWALPAPGSGLPGRGNMFPPGSHCPVLARCINAARGDRPAAAADRPRSPPPLRPPTFHVHHARGELNAPIPS